MTQRNLFSMITALLIFASITGMGFDRNHPRLTSSEQTASLINPKLLSIYKPSAVNGIRQTNNADTTSYNVLKFTKYVKRGKDARVSIKTEPRAKCFLSYRTPAGTQSRARGLGYKIANMRGICSWKWKISASTRPGTGSVYIAVNSVGKSWPIVIN
jgi:hypothetical protein